MPRELGAMSGRAGGEGRPLQAQVRPVMTSSMLSTLIV
jgi:hypothetical protein